MSYTYNLATDIGQLRLWLPDVATSTDPTPTGYIWEDEELQVFLDKANGDIQWARVFCYENRCAIESMFTGKEVEVGDIMIKGSGSAGTNWCEIAKNLREQLESGLGKESSFDPFYFAGGIYKADRDQFERDIENDILVERDFYDYYNESGYRGGSIGNKDDSNCNG